jgi:hypothetical protein
MKLLVAGTINILQKNIQPITPVTDKIKFNPSIQLTDPILPMPVGM